MRPDGVPWTEGVTEGRAGQRANGRSRGGQAGTDRTPTPDQLVELRPTPALTADQPLKAKTTFTERAVVTISGSRQPIVAILLMIALFTVLAGKPLDGLLLAIVAIALAWDAGMTARQHGVSADLESPGTPGKAASAWPDEAAWRPRAGRPRRRHIAIGVAGAAIYSLTVGSFPRMSWPATAGVVGLGAGVVIIGWGGPTRQREIPRRFSRAGALSWGGLLLAGCLWELGALLGQPTLAQSSYAHPTITTLTDPLLVTSLGRTAALIGWIALGAFLVER